LYDVFLWDAFLWDTFLGDAFLWDTFLCDAFLWDTFLCDAFLWPELFEPFLTRFALVLECCEGWERLAGRFLALVPLCLATLVLERLLAVMSCLKKNNVLFF